MKAPAKLVYVVATRGRPDLLKHCIDQTLGTLTNANTVLLVAADADDKPTINALEGVTDSRVIVSIKDREDTVAAKWNRALTLVSDADVYVPMADKSPFLTVGADSAILEAASRWPDGIGVIYGVPTRSGVTGFQAVTKPLTDIMGYIYPQIFPYWFVYPWLNDIMKQVGRIGFADVEIAHHLNQAPTQELREPVFWTNIYDALYLIRRKMAHKIIDATCDEPWRKTLHKSWYRMHEIHSKGNIAGTRGLAGKVKEPPADARYLRVKAAAQRLLRKMLPEIAADQAKKRSGRTDG